jgi:hypothetical protein
VALARKLAGISFATLETTAAAYSGELIYSSVNFKAPFILLIDSKSN